VTRTVVLTLPTNCAPNRCWFTAGNPMCSTLRRTSTWEGDKTRCCECECEGHRISRRRIRKRGMRRKGDGRRRGGRKRDER
jgi:hypothetical protein